MGPALGLELGKEGVRFLSELGHWAEDGAATGAARPFLWRNSRTGCGLELPTSEVAFDILKFPQCRDSREAEAPSAPVEGRVGASHCSQGWGRQQVESCPLCPRGKWLKAPRLPWAYFLATPSLARSSTSCLSNLAPVGPALSLFLVPCSHSRVSAKGQSKWVPLVARATGSN